VEHSGGEGEHNLDILGHDRVSPARQFMKPIIATTIIVTIIVKVFHPVKRIRKVTKNQATRHSEIQTRMSPLKKLSTTENTEFTEISM
jgi:hypothetical protein